MNAFTLFVLILIPVGALGILIAIVVANLSQSKESSKSESESEPRYIPKYQYRKRKYLLTRAENTCFKALTQAAGNDYQIFAQVHLSSLLDHTVQGQDWRAALSHIQRKSVDYVLCDKEYLSPKLAIELDDKTHERPDRMERDKQVEAVLQAAGVPLLRLENNGNLDPSVLKQKIETLALK